MPNRFFHAALFPKFAGILVASGIIALSAPAQAGFQWVAPSESGMAPPGMEMPAPVDRAPMPTIVEAPTESPQVISPVVIEGRDAPPPPAAQQSLPPLSVLPPVSEQPRLQPEPSVQPQTLGTLPVEPMPYAGAPGGVPAAPEDVVHGFANNVPLAVALRQILPSGYGFSVDQDVDLHTLVSFRGGQPWRDTLAAALQPAGLSMREQNQMIAVGHGANGAAPAATPAIAGGEPRVTDTISVSAAPAPVVMNMPNADMPMMVPPAAAAPTSAAPAAPVLRPHVKTRIDSGEGEKPVLTQPTVPPMNPVQAYQPAEPARSGPAFGVTDTWTGERGSSLRKVLENWSARVDIELQWLAEYDYPLQTPVSFNGTFEDAVRNLLVGFQDAHPQPIAAIHSNTGVGKAVLIVQTRGNSISD